jgi:hypothetical protein
MLRRKSRKYGESRRKQKIDYVRKSLEKRGRERVMALPLPPRKGRGRHELRQR